MLLMMDDGEIRRKRAIVLLIMERKSGRRH